MTPWWTSPDGRAELYQGNSLELLPQLPEASVDVVFADPPYFLSNGGSTNKSGKRAKVGKGSWDRSKGLHQDHAFQLAWLEACQRLLTKDGTIWVSGTLHVIYSLGFAMQKLGFKILNDVVWEKPNPPPHLACRYLTHSTEIVLWAARDQGSKHYFNYKALKAANGNKQLKNVWRFTAPKKAEKVQGKHPTQKPRALLDRIMLASLPEGGRVLDPFNGSGTTGVAALAAGGSYKGFDRDYSYLALTRRRLTAP